VGGGGGRTLLLSNELKMLLNRTTEGLIKERIMAWLGGECGMFLLAFKHIHTHKKVPRSVFEAETFIMTPWHQTSRFLFFSLQSL
jgi:hypothetical protein